MRVPCREQDVAQALKIGMRHHGIHELLADAFAAMLRNYEDVAEPRKCRSIGHDTCEGHLWRAPIGVAGERGKADRSVDRALYDVARDPRRPVRLVVKETPHEFAVNVSRIGRDDVLPHALATLDSRE